MLITRNPREPTSWLAFCDVTCAEEYALPVTLTSEPSLASCSWCATCGWRVVSLTCLDCECDEWRWEFSAAAAEWASSLAQGLGDAIPEEGWTAAGEYFAVHPRTPGRELAILMLADEWAWRDGSD